jgi:hypothetical protein
MRTDETTTMTARALGRAATLAVSCVALLLAFAPPAQAGRKVRVESQGSDYYYYRIDTGRGVRLVDQKSKADCREGTTWGYDRRGIWVDKGCRGEFEVDWYPGGDWGGWGGSGSSGGRTVRVESTDGKYQYARVDTRGGVRLKREMSRSDCREGSTWGWDRSGIWVDRGCRAEFEVGSGSGSGGSGWGGSSGGELRERTFRVESVDGTRVYSRVETRWGVQLKKQHSRADCVQGRTWGYDSGGIWVDQGCRADFTVFYR